MVCPHVVALGITLMLRHSDPLREQKSMKSSAVRAALAEVDANPITAQRARCSGPRTRVAAADMDRDFWQGAWAAPSVVAEDRLLSPRPCPNQLLLRVLPKNALLAVWKISAEGLRPTLHAHSSRPVNVLTSRISRLVQIEGTGPLLMKARRCRVTLRVDLTGFRRNADLPFRVQPHAARRRVAAFFS
jgi:hypothetical protein